ncbi:MAG: ribbon-helix-helix protein, CopG family [Robiginitomaculum sp.]|nr:ribbon-helix-helix protein, CopG family [Robiginitomaculum sp.]
MANTTVGIRLDDNTQARLKKLGNSRDRSPHYLMKEAVASYLKREEAVEAEKALLKSRWERFELTGEAITHSDMKAWAKTLSKPDMS